ncbi:hypothetical protein PTKIN_Ptkin16aG0047500 [Pterospermum kingtungense]
MDENLRRAAREGNVSDLYTLIQRDGNVLRRIDEVEFIDTPLHIAAAAGCIDFAMEIMSLKPSFARKLNHVGLSPIHIAIEKGHSELVLNLMENAKDLVRVKGKKGETPLHYVITREENPQLLPRFLENCPEFIRDVTTEHQTALHIAVRNNKEEALKFLCKMLRKTDYREDVVNQKDRNGDTALHIAARNNRHEIIKLLLKCKANKHATNLAGLTALKVAQQLGNRESISILRGSYLPRVSTFKYKFEKQVFKHVRNASAVIFQDMDSISSEDHSALLVILGLLLTATYQASLSPPGSVWQGDSSSNSTVNAGGEEKTTGKSVMDETDFLLFYVPTCAVFIVTFFLTLGLLKPFPRGFRTALQLLLAFLAICFFQSIDILAPTDSAAAAINLCSVLILFLMTLMCISYRVSQISVLILGTWLFSNGDLFQGFIGVTVVGYNLLGNILVVCWLLLLLFDEFWKGTAVGVGYCFFIFVPFDWFNVPFLNFVVLGCWLFLFLYDEFWKGSLFVVGFSVIFGVRFQAWEEPMISVGCWLFLSLCRFCIKRYNVRCNVLWRWMHIVE